MLVTGSDGCVIENMVLRFDVVILARRWPVLRNSYARRTKPENRQAVRIRVGQRLQKQVLVTLKIAVFAPIPSASDKTIIDVSRGFFFSIRMPYRKS